MKKINKSEFLTDQEKKLRQFCQENDIKFNLKTSPFGRGESSYEISFLPPFLDSIERMVVKFLESNGIRYNFFKDDDGNHHYEFNEFIPNGVLEFIDAPMPTLNRTYKKEIELVRDDLDIESLKSEIQTLKKGKDLIALRHWWQRALYSVWFPYRGRIQQANKRIADENDLSRKLAARKEKELNSLVAEKKEMRELLTLAGLI